ncbi:MAG: hypothetical protein SOI44_03040 [Lactimicrobium sp.]|jgi:hypothetical protein|uniref:hypothetical protein n=1 Tax=Lactimicrobium sp. TaxID=2563780 RepID=UPI002F3503BD
MKPNEANRQFHQAVQRYQDAVHRMHNLQQQRKEIAYRASGVHAVRYDSQSTKTYDPLLWIEKSTANQQKISECMRQVDAFESMMSMMDASSACLLWQVHIDHKTWKQAAENLGMSRDAAFHRCYRSIVHLFEKGILKAEELPVGIDS